MVQEDYLEISLDGASAGQEVAVSGRLGGYRRGTPLGHGPGS
jgi:hypothetical protein